MKKKYGKDDKKRAEEAHSEDERNRKKRLAKLMKNKQKNKEK